VAFSYIYAKGTTAGDTITNIATVDYSLANNRVTLQSNSDSFVVDRVVDIKLSWQDNSNVVVASGERDRVLTFIVSNLGNDKDSVSLEHISSGTNSFNPKPTNVRIYIDSNGDGVFNSSDKELSELSLNADENATLFIVSDIKEGNYTANSKDDEGIKATSKSVATSSKDRENSVDTVIRNKSAQDYGTYVIRDYYLQSTKSATVDSKDNKTHTGSIITYKITLKIGGDNSNKEISKIKLKDAIPSGTTYIDGSLKLNGVSLSDKKDSDAGYFENNEVVVDIGKIKDNQTKEVLFKVKVN
jgi:uncharacterized repeat protein (TIGR01451 family)